MSAGTISSKFPARIFHAVLLASVSLFGCGGEQPSDASGQTVVVMSADTGPSVTATAPANNASNVGLNTSVSATFSGPMSSSTINTASFTLRPSAGGAAVVGNITSTGNTATFTPSSSLTGSTQYTATITTEATDNAGNPISGNYVWRFSTGAAPDTTPPTVSSTSPANNAVNAALNTSVSATFSEAMTNATLTNATFTVRPNAGGANITGSVNVSGNTATFTPSGSLAANTRYRATITTAATDSAGNALTNDYTWTFTTAVNADSTPPTVSAISPANNATGISLNSSVSATFSEAMTNATLTNATFTLRPSAGGANVAGTVVVNGNTATFTPGSALAGSTQFTATISGSVVDAAGNALGSNYTWRFTTGAAPDTTPPTVVSTSPDRNATDMPLNSSVSATFSEAMDNSTLTTASFTLLNINSSSDVTGTVSVSGNTVTFTPSVDLAGNTEYRARISTDATDAAGNALGSNYNWRFTTAPAPDATAPTVISTSPANNATGVAHNASISATFSEAMANATLTNASFTLRRASGASVGGTVNVSGNTATFTPTASLAANTQFTATISTDVTDAAGNALVATYSWNFTTALATANNTAILEWDAAPVSNLNHYRVYYGTTSGSYFQPLGSGLNAGNNLTYTVSGLASGTRYHFAVTSVDNAGKESAYSGEVFKDIP